MFIANPGMPYVGWLLFACGVVPYGHKAYKRIGIDEIPRSILWVSWFLVAIGYTASGIHKLQCPSWIDGSALSHVLNGPLSRDNFVRDFMVSLPPTILQFLTWGSLAFEISFLPFGVFYNTRLIFWCGAMMFHIGILATVNFTDLTMGMIMIHLFTMEDRWTNGSLVQKFVWRLYNHGMSLIEKIQLNGWNFLIVSLLGIALSSDLGILGVFVGIVIFCETIFFIVEDDMD